jgi:hypothetical protein
MAHSDFGYQAVAPSKKMTRASPSTGNCRLPLPTGTEPATAKPGPRQSGRGSDGCTVLPHAHQPAAVPRSASVGRLTRPGRRLAYSVRFTITEDIAQAILQIPARAWTPAYDSERQVRPGAWVAELTGMLDLASWPAGMRVIVRKERPHSGAQLRFTDLDGHRFTCFATSTRTSTYDRKDNRGPVEPPPTRRDSRATKHDHGLKDSGQPQTSNHQPKITKDRG